MYNLLAIFLTSLAFFLPLLNLDGSDTMVARGGGGRGGGGGGRAGGGRAQAAGAGRANVGTGARAASVRAPIQRAPTMSRAGAVVTGAAVGAAAANRNEGYYYPDSGYYQSTYRLPPPDYVNYPS